ncbi:hypothetical protein SAMN05421780_103155 [Flexibacter flexilis DSM 6793]|uniref:Glycerophosphoryl diester phosphodiesterase n=1 Tax=Flexibacter flexilis DSM 6793 TaxID=927664 RepID=A0A1I1H0G9_9BACT|nr:hypothetical protein [Flexibacter flexilis]SFC17236.1 hypothetical protein SAMN05421780_103155 [Flexibacter flexilis DSM 6793]
MHKIAHRINTIEQLKALTDKSLGVELDLRYEGKDLVLHHDALRAGDLHFEDYLKEYHQTGTMILNVKTEGIEEEVLRLLQKYNVTNYFFLDLSLPFLIKYMKKGESKIAIRYSEYEPIELALAFAGKIEWVWVDCFSHLPLDSHTYKQLKDAGFKICLVSPELQAHPLEWIETFKKQLDGLEIDAVCTKKPELW